jgi:RNA polymerase sigma-70 factor (ECF subfamily)
MTSPNRQNHDQQRFADWGNEHGTAVWGYLLAMVRRTDVADDLTQEVFCKAWQARDRYREEGNARAYLMRIADRLLIDRGRKSQREITLDAENWERIEPISPAAGPPQSAANAESARQLARALERLSPLQRRVVLLRYYGRLSFAEIAETVDCPLNTALSHCRRGLGALREILVEKVQ